MLSCLKDLLLLTLVVGTLFGATLGKYPLAAPDGARYAEIPREMVATGDYITPHLNGVKYFEKPPLFYWLQAASIKALGANDWAVSLVNALMALLTTLIIYLTSRTLYGRSQAITASLIFASSALVFVLTRIVTLDVTLTFFVTASLASFLLATRLSLGRMRTLHLWLMYACAAGSVMTKGLVGIVLPGMIISIWLTATGEWRNLKTYKLASGSCIFLLLVAPWHLLVQIKNPEFFYFYFVEQHFLRYFTDYAERSQKWWFFPVVLAAGLYPWTAFLIQAVAHSLPRSLKMWRESKTKVFLLLWIVVIYLFYTFSDSKLIPYLLPIFPPIAMLMGNYFVDLNNQNNHSWRTSVGFWALSALSFILGAVALLAIFILDFNDQAFTRENLGVVASFMWLNAGVTLIAYRKDTIALAFAALLIITSSIWLYLSPIMTSVNRQSIKPLITTMQQKLKPEDEVICYRGYYHELPFYLGRIVTVVDYTGELNFGTLHQDTRAWMIDQKTFWEHWQKSKENGRTIYLITREDHYRELKSRELADDGGVAAESGAAATEQQGSGRHSDGQHMRIVAKLWDTVLVVK